MVAVLKHTHTGCITYPLTIFPNSLRRFQLHGLVRFDAAVLFGREFSATGHPPESSGDDGLYDGNSDKDDADYHPSVVLPARQRHPDKDTDSCSSEDDDEEEHGDEVTDCKLDSGHGDGCEDSSSDLYKQCE